MVVVVDGMDTEHSHHNHYHHHRVLKNLSSTKKRADLQSQEKKTLLYFNEDWVFLYSNAKLILFNSLINKAFPQSFSAGP